MNVKEFLHTCKNLKVLIIGDVMLDAYYSGKVERISPEAPVPILNVKHAETRLGGAANVALNIQALGAEPVLCAVIGNDRYTASVLELMKKHRLNAAGLITSKERISTVKTRLMGSNHHLLRVDEEMTTPLSAKDEKSLLSVVLKQMKSVQAIIFEDYDKGVITPRIIEQVVKEATKRKIPVVVDPKKNNFLNYKGVTLFKPNLKELREGLKLDTDLKNHTHLESAIFQLKNLLKAKHVMVTLSEDGVAITEGNKKMHHIAAHIRKISDVSGAGDTVVSVATLALAAGCSVPQVAAYANLAGGLVCEQVGVVPIDKKRFAAEAQLYQL